MTKLEMLKMHKVKLQMLLTERMKNGKNKTKEDAAINSQLLQELVSINNRIAASEALEKADQILQRKK